MASFGDFGEEEEDVKPSVEYLNSLGDYRKRSRSSEDVGSAGPVKTPKLHGLSTPNGLLSPVVGIDVFVDVGEDIKLAPSDDPTVMGLYSAPLPIQLVLKNQYVFLSGWPAYTILTNYRRTPGADDPG